MLPLGTRRTWLWLSFVACLLLVQQGRGFETPTGFSGNLERVGEQSISVRLADRRVIDAMLPDNEALNASALADEYSIGDQVDVKCKPIPPVWEEGTSRYQSLEVTSLRLARKPSPDELAKLFEGVPFREGKNLLTRPRIVTPPPGIDGDHPAARGKTDVNAPGGRELEHARQVNLDYAANLPNFVADETAKRFRSSTKSGPWRKFDTIESEITFRGNRAVRQQMRRDGKPWTQPFEALPGFKWYEGFGTEISPLFDPQCPTTLDFQGRTKVHERELLEYSFRSPVDGCFPYFYFDYQRFNPARTGHVFIDGPGNIIQLDEEAREFPAEIEFTEREEHVTWDYVKIGQDSHLLPVRSNFLVRYYSGTRYRVEVEYKNHRHFESSTNLTFQ